MKKGKFRLRISFKGKSLAIESTRLYSYIKENWGAPFIITFMILLLSAAGALINNLEALANEIAIYAYYSLCIGVFLQFLCFLKYGEKGNEDNK
jgi:hypothetical protein